MLKYTKICKPRTSINLFYLLNHRFIALEIKIPKSPFFINGCWVFEFFHVFHVERDSIDLISICKPTVDIDRFFSYLPKASN